MITFLHRAHKVSFIRSSLLGLAAILYTSSLTPMANAAGALVIGDSIGVGISMASGAPRLAHNSVTIRSTDAVSQVRRVPRGTVAVLSLGTNDAVGSIAGVEAGIERIIAANAATGNQLVWVGPPCVLKVWNTNVVKLDQILRSKLSGRASITYVSVADSSICGRDLRAGDGVHFTMHGYGVLWARARAAGGLPAASEAGESMREAAPPRKHRKAARHRRKAAASPAAPAIKAEKKN